MREEKSIEFIASLQKLFAMMLEGNRTFVDPTEVLNLVYDETSKKVDVGDQRDIIEYLMIFFEHMEVGMRLCNEEPKDLQQTDNSIVGQNFELKIMDIFKGKLVSEIIDNKITNKFTNLVEEDFGPLLVDVRYSDLLEALRKKFMYPIKMNTHEVI